MVLATLIGLSPGVPVPAEDGSPLDRLRERSAEVRWEQQRNQWMVPAEPQAADPATAPGDPELDSTDPAVESGTTPQDWPRAHSLFDPIELAPTARSQSAADSAATAWAPATVKPNRDSDADEAAPPAPPATADVAPSSPDRDGAALHSLADTDRRSSPQQAAVLPLPDFLNGTSPLWLAPRLRAAPRGDGGARTAGIAGSQLVVAQNQSAESTAVRERGMLRPITDINPFLDYNPDGGDACEYLCPVPPALCGTDANHLCPEEEPLPESGDAERYFAHMNYFWAASDVFHNPLYFEDPLLERYGHVHVHEAVQPLYSMAHFGGQLIGLPYQMALCPVHDRVYPLGYYRPGDPAPKLIYQPPLNARAGAVATGIYTGLFFLVP